jgi:hypothetical protein
MIRIDRTRSTARSWAMTVALVLVTSAAFAMPSGGSRAATPPTTREALLQKAEQSLAAGRADEAAAALDSAVAMAHEADAELLQVRCLMQQGRFRPAASLAAHTAGDHRDGLLPVALYAWLLELAGQESIGRARLEAAMREASAAGRADDPIALAVMRAITTQDIPASPVLLMPPHRFAPYAYDLGVAPPASARVVAVGVAWEGGANALVPAAAVAGGGRFWVRNGLGQTVAAKASRRIPGLDLVLLELDMPVPDADARWATRDPFAGSPGFVADYPPVAAAEPAWPRVRHGFLGGATLSSPVRRLGVPLFAGSRGGAVFDKSGRAAGVAVATSQGGTVFLTVSQVRRALGESDAAAGAQRDEAVMAFDAAYEQAMRMTLQVIGAQ